MNPPLLARAALPFARLELPGWGKVLTAAGVFDHARWKDAPRRTVRGKIHGYRMRLALANWSERQTYFLGRYYELGTQLFVLAALREGDSFIDVGGNIGMITLVAARRVGPGGQVHTFEPNPQAVERIREALSDNAIGHVTLHPVGLSDQASTLTLSVITDHMGMGTFAEPTEKDRAHVSARHTVQVCPGDDLVPPDLPGCAVVKMDVEGFECRALRGLLGTIRRHRPALITEVCAAHLQRAGHSVVELFEILRGEGYQAFSVEMRRKFLRQRLSLRLISSPVESMDCNVAWVRPGTPHEKRLRQFIDD
jgi:FkbM family methyltransferase